MEITVSQILFFVLAAVIGVGSVLAVTARKILRAATYLLFVLIATAGIYMLLNYHFLAMIQLSVYVGGILVLFVFSIFLTSQVGEEMPEAKLTARIAGIVAAVLGVGLIACVVYMQGLPAVAEVPMNEINMQLIGTTLLGTGKFGYLLAFEAISVLLLACIVGGIIIARRK